MMCPPKANLDACSMQNGGRPGTVWTNEGSIPMKEAKVLPCNGIHKAAQLPLAVQDA